MDIQVGSESSIATPAAGYRTLFINTDKGNALYYKYSDGTFAPYTGDSSADLTEIAEAWSKGLTCALKTGIITAVQYESILNVGLVIVTTVTPDPANTGAITTTVSIGSRTIPVTLITLDSSVQALLAITPGTHQIVTTFTPANASNQGLIYVSSDITKATVSSTGLITAVAAGVANISVIPQDNPSLVKIVVVTVS